MRLTQEKNKRVEIPNDEDGGFVNIRVLTLHEISAIEAKCNSTGLSESSDVMIQLDPFKRENMIAKACMTGWGHLFDVKGKEMKFNRKNLQQAQAFVIRVEDEKIRFLEWVDQQHSIFYEEVEEEMKDAVKN